jgi:Fe-S cluster assembly protein SufD
VVSFGGDTVRVTPSIYFDGPGASVDMFGVYFADANQHLEHRPFVDHSQPNCKSRVTYKGALQGDKAHTVWVGDVLIRKEAEGTDTYELNRNLLLTDGARADSVPNLEIETGQIEGAGHASASGRFDDEHLFYLQARGINELEARRLVVKGFLNEIVQQIGIESIEDRLNKSIEEELKRSVK